MFEAANCALLQLACESDPASPPAARCHITFTTTSKSPQPRRLAAWRWQSSVADNHERAGLVNKLGQYYCWNRIYDINTGRWTTPDPVASPWWDLFEYCVSRPIQRSDPKGLATIFIHGAMGGTEGEGMNRIAREYERDYKGKYKHDPFTSDQFDDIVNYICDIVCADPDEPICIVGYSWGGGTAIKLAQYFDDHKCVCKRAYLYHDVSRESCGSQEYGWHILHWEEEVRAPIRYIALIDAVTLFRNIGVWIPKNYLTSYRIFRSGWNFFDLVGLAGFSARRLGIPGWMLLSDWFMHHYSHLDVVGNKEVRKRIIEDLKYYDKHK